MWHKRDNKIEGKRRHRWINGTRGAISLFLAILMVPFVSIAGALLNAGRINSAVAIFDEMLCNASNSTLGTYDEFLRKRFGLLAMSQSGAVKGVNYTGQEFIAETFAFYMEESLGALSNTYLTSDTSAAGIYPLADKNVLISRVMEGSKYAVPTKLVINGLSIDSIIKSLTKKFSTADHAIKTMTSVTKTVDSIGQCDEKMETLRDKLDKAKTEGEAYRKAFEEFQKQAKEYNELVDERNTAVEEAEKKVEKAEEEAASPPPSPSPSPSPGPEPGASPSPAPAAEDPSEKVEKAKKALEDTKKEYAERLSEKRDALLEAKGDYETAIQEYIDALKAAKSATTDAQAAMQGCVDAGADLIKECKDFDDNEIKKDEKEDIEDLKERQKKATEENRDKDAEELGKQIDAAEKAQRDRENETAKDKIAIKGGETVSKTLSAFAKVKYEEQFDAAVGTLTDLKKRVTKYEGPEKDEEKAASVSESNYYAGITLPIDGDYVQQLLVETTSNAVASGTFDLIGALANFVAAILGVLWYNPLLCANVDGSYYESMGGLPSQRDRTDPSYSLTSPYDGQDKAQSEYYKSILGKYSSGGLGSTGESFLEEQINTIKTKAEHIAKCKKEISWTNFFSKLASMIKDAVDILISVGKLMAKLLEAIASAAYQKLLLAGYIGYNTANRTTYEGKSLMGASYALPPAANKVAEYKEENGKIAFYGAETEYIMVGNSSETANQAEVFKQIYLIRMAFDLPVILLDGEVSAIAEAAGAPTFGIGTFLVYVLYILVEPLVDGTILAHGSTIPLIKTGSYLTPSGILDLIGKFTSIKLDGDEKNAVYEGVGNVMSFGFNQDFAKEMADAERTGGGVGTGVGVVDAISYDYTKMLILIMLFKDPDKMLDRLADVVQMEGSYNAKEKGLPEFNLDRSYTYLRASGKFSTSEFIRLSDGGGLTSKERVIYRGY